MKNSFSKFVPVTLLIALLVATAPPNQAQVPTTMTQVSCLPDGPAFLVDGGAYAHTMSAFWPIGSKHTLTIPQGYGLSYNQDYSIMYSFLNWQWLGGTLPGSSIAVTADPNIQQYVAIFNAQYLFGMQFSCSNANPCPASPGTIFMNGTPYSSSMTSWQSPGVALVLQVFPNPGLIFARWQAGPNQAIVGFQDTVTLNTPMTVYPVFVPAKTINFSTNPASMKVYADGVLLETPTSVEWGASTIHSIAAIATQNDSQFQPWLFS